MMARTMPKAMGYHWDLKDAVIRDDGKPPCRWCRGPVEKPRRTMCSTSCVNEWKRRISWDITRLAVFRRDLGICAGCGVDTETLRSEANKAAESAVQWVVGNEGAVYTRYKPGRYHLWEVDHIVPVAEGGDYFDLLNLQTLCLACHRRKTADQARRKAEARRKTVSTD